MKKIRVLVVDDSALMRALLVKGLAQDPMIEVVGCAQDPYEARDLLVRHRPDVLTLDVEMPRMDGVTFLRKLMAKMPTPTVMLSSLTERGARISLAALEAGAVEVLEKPARLVEGMPEMMADIRRAVRSAANARLSPPSSSSAAAPAPLAGLTLTTDKVIAIGASTGGVEALTRILPRFPADAPGIVLVEHMPAAFTRAFAERLDRICSMGAEEAAEGARVRPGRILVAPGGTRHVHIERSGGQYRVRLIEGKPEDRHVPSVDALFESTAGAAGKNAVGILLTGMGDDGARGMLALRAAGARTFVQDEKSCVVFGMPKAALELGAAERAVPLDDLPQVALASLAR